MPALILVISEQDPERARKWKQWLEEFKIDAIERRELDLGEELPPLIEDFAQDLDIQIQLQSLTEKERLIETSQVIATR